MNPTDLRWLDYLVAEYVLHLPGVVSHWPCLRNYDDGSADPVYLDWLEPEDGLLEWGSGFSDSPFIMEPVSYFICSDGGINDGCRWPIPRYSADMAQASELASTLYEWWQVTVTTLRGERPNARVSLGNTSTGWVGSFQCAPAEAIVRAVLCDRGIPTSIPERFGYERGE